MRPICTTITTTRPPRSDRAAFACYGSAVRHWILVVMASALLASMTLGTVVVALDPTANCDDEDGCPPFSDDCGDCAQCFHVNAVPTVVAVIVASRVARDVVVPVASPSRRPIAPPSREILTIPRA